MKTLLMAALLGAAATGLPMQAGAQPGMAIEVGEDQTVLDLAVRGTSTRVPDVVNISAGVVTTAPTAAEALRQNSETMQRIVRALRQAGVKERDIRTQRINLNPRYDDRGGYENRKIIGYQAQNMVSVKFREIEQSGRILDVLVGEGANQIYGPNFELDDPAEALDEARADALEQARERAGLYAAALGKRVVRLAYFSEGGAQMPSPIVVTGSRIRMEAADAAPPVAPGEQEVGITLNLRYILE
ncbi:SIMPL domain-containing protein [Sphingomicrobium aestuariivivum]|uniref:SIMPL domain-containing protein n=1 Tax=Sphingomicrobium aestuariivivum TaxID=1582356 RepID=UPI001FD6F746|nr:SIMPL domain-containing protein [Sphingomicrobium aestuariivivum]MCJ8191530.1 SIMPL domain-containing protein [Sphingomicrobium aestuariivivum]